MYYYMSKTKKHSTIHYPANYKSSGGNILTSWTTDWYKSSVINGTTLGIRRHKHKTRGKRSKKRTHRKH
jgi:hypothetical protein